MKKIMINAWNMSHSRIDDNEARKIIMELFGVEDTIGIQKLRKRKKEIKSLKIKG